MLFIQILARPVGEVHLMLEHVYLNTVLVCTWSTLHEVDKRKLPGQVPGHFSFASR